MSNKIYIIKNGDKPKYKIGLSKDPEKRIKEMQTGNPEKLDLLFARKITKNSTEGKVRNTLLNTDAYEKADGGSEWIIKKYERTKIIDDVNHAIEKCETNIEEIDHTYELEKKIKPLKKRLQHLQISQKDIINEIIKLMHKCENIKQKKERHIKQINKISNETRHFESYRLLTDKDIQIIEFISKIINIFDKRAAPNIYQQGNRYLDSATKRTTIIQEDTIYFYDPINETLKYTSLKQDEYRGFAAESHLIPYFSEHGNLFLGKQIIPHAEITRQIDVDKNPIDQISLNLIDQNYEKEIPEKVEILYNGKKILFTRKPEKRYKSNVYQLKINQNEH